MSLRLSFTVPGEPVPCPRPKVALRGGKPRAYLPGAVRAYEAQIRALAAAACPPGWRSDWSSFRVHVTVFRAERRGDADNYAKAALDGLQPAREAPDGPRVLDNDSAVRRLVVELVDDLQRPRLEVTVAMVGELDTAADRKARSRTLRRRP